MNVKFAVAVALAACLAQAGELVVAERRKPAECSIVIPADAGASVKYAAEELRDHIRWIENGSRFAFREGGWRKFLERRHPIEPSDSDLVPAESLMPNRLNVLQERFVNDRDAMFGKSLMLYPSHYGWTARLDARRIAYDPDAKYRVRIHVKVDKKKGGDGEAFWAGVRDSARRKSCGSISVKAKDVKDGWSWYDVVAEWTPEPGQYFWFGPGRFGKDARESPAHRGVYIDALEISRCP